MLTNPTHEYSEKQDPVDLTTLTFPQRLERLIRFLETKNPTSPFLVSLKEQLREFNDGVYERSLQDIFISGGGGCGD